MAVRIDHVSASVLKNQRSTYGYRDLAVTVAESEFLAALLNLQTNSH